MAKAKAKTYKFGGLTLSQAEAETVERGIRDDDLVVYLNREGKKVEVKLRDRNAKTKKLERIPFKNGPKVFI